MKIIFVLLAVLFVILVFAASRILARRRAQRTETKREKTYEVGVAIVTITTINDQTYERKLQGSIRGDWYDGEPYAYSAQNRFNDWWHKAGERQVLAVTDAIDHVIPLNQVKEIKVRYEPYQITREEQK